MTTNEAIDREFIEKIKLLSDEQCIHILRVIRIIEPLTSEQADKVIQLLEDGMTLDELDALLENGGIPE